MSQSLRTMKNLEIPCPSCEGTGKREISKVYTDTLAIFKEGKKLTSPQVADKLSLPLSAAIMRIQRLATWGFLCTEPQAGRAGTLYFRKASK